MCVCVQSWIYIYIFIYIYTYIYIWLNIIDIFVYIFFNPFVLPYRSYDIWRELVDKPSIMSYFPSTWEITKDGWFINQFPPNIIRSIRQYERINKKYLDKNIYQWRNAAQIYLYIYMRVCVCVVGRKCVCKFRTENNLHSFKTEHH